MMTAAGDPTGSADSQAVTQLVLRERQCRDRGWWEEMGSCFAADAIIDMSWFSGPATDFIRQTEVRSGNGVWGRHRVSPPAVRVVDDRAWAELPLGIEFDFELDSVAAELVSYCRSQYRARRGDGEIWRLERITSIYERDTLMPSVPATRLAIDPATLDGYRSSYRCLAWYFERRGAPLPDDLLGDDRPDAVARQYAAEHEWLSGGG